MLNSSSQHPHLLYCPFVHALSFAFVCCICRGGSTTTVQSNHNKQFVADCVCCPVSACLQVQPQGLQKAESKQATALAHTFVHCCPSCTQGQQTCGYTALPLLLGIITQQGLITQQTHACICSSSCNVVICMFVCHVFRKKQSHDDVALTVSPCTMLACSCCR